MTKFQITVECLLKKLNKLSDFKNNSEFYLKLSNDPYMDLIIERQGNVVMVGHYREQNGDLISDPVLVFYLKPDGEWFPWRVEQVFGDFQVASEREDGKLEWWVNRLKDFISFSAVFASNIEHQGWHGAKIKRFKAVS